jgi:hypothetical protein
MPSLYPRSDPAFLASPQWWTIGTTRLEAVAGPIASTEICAFPVSGRLVALAPGQVLSEPMCGRTRRMTLEEFAAAVFASLSRRISVSRSDAPARCCWTAACARHVRRRQKQRPRRTCLTSWPAEDRAAGNGRPRQLPRQHHPGDHHCICWGRRPRTTGTIFKVAPYPARNSPHVRGVAIHSSACATATDRTCQHSC